MLISANVDDMLNDFRHYPSVAMSRDWPGLNADDGAMDPARALFVITRDDFCHPYPFPHTFNIIKWRIDM